MEIEEQIEPTEDVEEGTPSHCLACDARLRSHQILICAECLNIECNEFSSLLADDLEEIPE